jgi:hypothetical protein
MADGDDTVSTSDETSEVEESSWLERLGQSFVGILFGIVFIIGACVLLFWNEGRAVATAKSLTEGSGVVRSVSADTIDPQNEGKLVYVTADLTTSGPAVDTEFGVTSSGVRIMRQAEMFQWVEDQQSESHKKLGGGEETRTTYKYKRDWSEQPEDSSKFRDRRNHTNPQMIYRTRTARAPQVNAGAFIVPPGMLYRFGDPQALAVTDDQAQAMKQKIGKDMQAADGVLYIAGDPTHPEIGDYRITFTEVPVQTVSIVAQQAGSTFMPYRTKAGGTVQLIKSGKFDATDLFKEARSDNRTWTWLIRLGGFVLMFFGFVLITRPLAVLADVIPFLGDIVGAGLGIVGLLATFIVAPIVVATAWFVYRPVIAVIVLAVGAVVVVGVGWLGKQRRARKPAAPAAV